MLYIFYLTFYICLFLTNDFYLAYYLLLYVIGPIALVPVSLRGSLTIGPFALPRPFFSLSNTFHTLEPARSWIFVWTMLFGLTMVISTSLTPNGSIGWFWSISTYLLSIALFMLVTARLAINFDDFYGAFFTFFSLIMSVNALINLYDYFQSLTYLRLFIDVRFSTDFGRVPDHYYTTGAMTYTTGLVAALGVLTTETCIIRKTFASVCSLILFVSLFLTQSRGPLLATLISFLVLLAVNQRRKLRYILSYFSLFLFFVFLRIPKIGSYAIERGDNHRFEVWKKFADMALERPLLGYGERIQVLLEISNGEKVGHGHNIFLSAFFRTGFSGLISLFFVYAISLYRTYQYAKYYNNALPLGLILSALIAGLVDFDQMIFLPDWQWVSFWMPLGLAVAADRIMLFNRFALNKF